MRYTELLGKSLQTVWDFKVIWLFGILLVVSSGPASIMLNLPYAVDKQLWGVALYTERFLSMISGSGQRNLQYMVVVAMAVISYVLVSVVFYFLFSGSIIAHIKAISGNNKPRARTSLYTGLHKTLPMITQSLTIGVPYFVIVCVISTTSIIMLTLKFLTMSPLTQRGLILAIVFTLLAGIILIVGGITAVITNSFAHRFIILDDVGAIASIKKATIMFRRNLKFVLPACLLLVAAGILILIAYFVIIAVLSILVMRITAVNLTAALLVALAASLALFAFAGFIKAFFNVFWTYLFLTLKNKEEHGEALEAKSGKDAYQVDEGLACLKIEADSTSAQHQLEILKTLPFEPCGC
ncbi:MAG: hypothetical protein K6T91_07875 [Firmicutes bacterium]|nr:hypothetical protein [Bacillota bacterium]